MNFLEVNKHLLINLGNVFSVRLDGKMIHVRGNLDRSMEHLFLNEEDSVALYERIRLFVEAR